MRTFIITKNGVARVMRTYALDKSGSAIPDSVEGPDAADEIAKWNPQNQSEVTGFREIDEADIPALYQFKDAWRDTGTAINTDMPVARTIHMGRIRRARDGELSRQDAELAKAEDDNDATRIAAVKAKRKSLRDIPQTFDLSGAPTPDALAALWPVEVPRKSTI